MRKKDEDIAAMLVFIAFISHILSYFFWQYVKSVNIFYVTIYFNMFVDGFVFMMVTRGKLFKLIAGLMFWGGSHLTYMEFYRDPQHWTVLDIVVFGIAGINSIIISEIMDKLKNKRNG